MTDIQTQFIEVSQLRIGMFIYLDVGWMDHPFPVSNFKICSQAQIETIQSLGIERIRYAPAKSELNDQTEQHASTTISAAVPDPDKLANQLRKAQLAEQQASLQVCEKQFAHAAMTSRQISEMIHTHPQQARELSEQLIQNFLNEVLGEDEAAIRLLSEKAGEKSSLHAVNVTVISLLLGKTLKLNKQEMLDLGMAAFLHDIGKIELPDRLRWVDEQYSATEKQLFYQHVMHSVSLGKKMGLNPSVLLAIAQHHEFSDGAGYPNHLHEDKLPLSSRILALVNFYDNLCNSNNPALAITPHEALSQIFTQYKHRFHAATLTSFIRMMGIYPPGSVVQLTDERYAMVVSVNPGRPIKPRVIIHNPEIPRDEALVINLESEPILCIQRSLKPLQLPKAAYDYLSPRRRLCYFFERGLEVDLQSNTTGVK